jgi:stage IV sporulation protein FB
MLSEPQETGADLRFEIAGFPVRVSAWFWLAAVLLGWPVCQAYSAGDQRALIQFLVIWTGVVFVSILVHELGHALAYRWFGQGAQIVIYHFGGLAIPDRWGRRTHLRPIQRLAVSAAGPLAQFALAAAVTLLLTTAGYRVPLPFAGLRQWVGIDEGRAFASPFTFALADFLLYVNIFWPLLNLVPVPPLDGGQIVREALLSLGLADAHRIAGGIGVIVGGAVAWWGYTRGQPFLGIMFLMLAVSCWQGLSAGGPWRR